MDFSHNSLNIDGYIVLRGVVYEADKLNFAKCSLSYLLYKYILINLSSSLFLTFSTLKHV